MQANQYGSAIIGDFPQQDRIPPPHQAGNIPVPRQGVDGHAATPEPLSLLNGGGSLLPPYQQQPQQQTLPHRQPFGSKNSSTGDSRHFAPVLITISPHASRRRAGETASHAGDRVRHHLCSAGMVKRRRLLLQ